MKSDERKTVRKLASGLLKINDTFNLPGLLFFCWFFLVIHVTLRVITFHYRHFSPHDWKLIKLPSLIVFATGFKLIDSPVIKLYYVFGWSADFIRCIYRIEWTKLLFKSTQFQSLLVSCWYEIVLNSCVSRLAVIFMPNFGGRGVTQECITDSN